MISFDFEYYRPTCADEAVELFKNLDSQSKSPIYYSGGTEIICMARVNQISTKAVIDIKEIPECNVLGEKDSQIAIGAAVTLTKICEANLFPSIYCFANLKLAQYIVVFIINATAPFRETRY